MSQSDYSCSSSDEAEISDLMYVDAFPSKIFDQCEFSDFAQTFLWSSTIESLKESKMDAIPVIPFKMRYDDENKSIQRVVFQNLAIDKRLLRDRFDRLYDDACVRNTLTGHMDVDWDHVNRKLLKNPRLTHRFARSTTNKVDGKKRKGHADNRQSFVLRQTFLVKQHVTTGARTTGPNEYHLYQLQRVPLMLYMQMKGIQAPEASFYPADRENFKPFLLKPDRGVDAYFVQPSTTYISISLQKTCYSVTRVTSSLFTELINRHYTFRPAFSEENDFKALPRAELDRMKSNVPKRKRGRPAKSLDSIYWYPQKQARDTVATTTTAEIVAVVSAVTTQADITSNLAFTTSTDDTASPITTMTVNTVDSATIPAVQTVTEAIQFDINVNDIPQNDEEDEEYNNLMLWLYEKSKT